MRLGSAQRGDPRLEPEHPGAAPWGSGGGGPGPGAQALRRWMGLAPWARWSGACVRGSEVQEQGDRVPRGRGSRFEGLTVHPSPVGGSWGAGPRPKVPCSTFCQTRGDKKRNKRHGWRFNNPGFCDHINLQTRAVGGSCRTLRPGTFTKPQITLASLRCKRFH